MKSTLVCCMALLGFVVHADGNGEEPRPQYGIKEDTPRTGTNLRRYAVKPAPIPINRRYDQLSATDRAVLHSWWEAIPQGDEPPFPVDGLRPIHDAVRRAQERLQVRGELALVATVGPDGEVVSVTAVGSPSPEMTKFAATVLTLTKFKPAVCSGKPCQMDFPVHYKFELD